MNHTPTLWKSARERKAAIAIARQLGLRDVAHDVVAFNRAYRAKIQGSPRREHFWHSLGISLCRPECSADAARWSDIRAALAQVQA